MAKGLGAFSNNLTQNNSIYTLDLWRKTFRVLNLHADLTPYTHPFSEEKSSLSALIAEGKERGWKRL